MARVMRSPSRRMTITVCESRVGRPTGGEVRIKGENVYWRSVGPYEALYANGGAYEPRTVLEKKPDDWIEI